MTHRRSNWERLQRLWVTGEPLTLREQAERVEAARDPDQQSELQFYQRAERWLDQQSSEQAADDARFLEHALRLAKIGRSTALRLVGDAKPTSVTSPRKPRQAKPRVWRTVVWLSAAAAAAAAIALVWHPSVPAASTASISKRPGASAGQTAHCELSTFSGAVELPRAAGPAVVGAALREGDQLATAAGTACLTIDESVRVCLANDSAVALTSLKPQDLRIQVLRGGSIAALSPRPIGSFFSLTGGGVVATAHGTVYALELTPNPGVAEVTVFEGSVEVHGANEQSLVSSGIRAQFEAATRHWARTPVADQERTRWLSWLHGPPPRAIAEVTARDSAIPRDSAAPPRTPAAPSTGSPEAAAGLSRDALFTAARKQAGLGHARAARALYRDLLTRYPGPGTAAVEVVLGNLELELGAPERALTAFESYLRAGGPLEPEALHGKVRALRALGRTAEESATIRAYLARYPGGFQAPTLKKRLQELE
jgi:FecR protein